MSLIDKTNQKPIDRNKTNYLNVQAYFRLTSKNCTVDIDGLVNVSDEEREAQALYYSLTITLVCLCHLYATVSIIKALTQNEYDGGRYSLVTLCYFTIWDVFLCLFHLYTALLTEVSIIYFPGFDFSNRTSSIISSLRLSGSSSYLLFLKPD